MQIAAPPKDGAAIYQNICSIINIGVATVDAYAFSNSARSSRWNVMLPRPICSGAERFDTFRTTIISSLSIRCHS